jgi:outer membrane lipoprotein-sorting protein
VKIAGSILILLLISAGMPVRAFGDRQLDDPYKILESHFNAIGGLDRLEAQTTAYKEGKITIVGAGLEGTFKQWSERPLKSRQETDLKVVSEISGDNGDMSWHVDANGKLLIRRDENTLKERRVRRLMSEYEYANPATEYFALTYEGIEKVDNKDCYVVKMTNTINRDVQRNFYDKSSFYLLKEIITRPDNEHQVIYSDFRKVEGLVLPFKETVRELPTNETITVEYSIYELNPKIESALFEPPAQDVEDFVFLNGKSAEDIPFQYIEEHIYLPVNLNGKERLWVLDCGASVNVIDSSFAAELGLPFEGPVKGRGASGVVDFYFVALPEYSLGEIKFEKQKAVALSFRQIFEKVLGMEVVGILGYDFLSRFVTKIDFAKRKISFYHPDHFEYSGTGTIFDSPLDGNMLSLPAKVDGEYSGRFRLDIGAPDIDFHYPYAKDHDLLERKGIDVMVGDAAGLTNARIAQHKTIEVGDFVLKNPLIGTPREEGTGSFAEETTIGNIGNSLLKNFVLYLDYGEQRVILEKGEDYGKEIPRPKSGLQFHYNDDNDVEVVFVSPNTPAHGAGFEKGDIIKTINGIDVSFYDGIIALRELMREPAGTTYEIGILRKGRMLEKQLTLKDLF